ncbi:MAG TPA: lysophospholipid acyltransferase family protein [Steroidobacteraceae bacterium]|nr:lysophospholipid acyltransferase family protein [Steroidobacteraceae bacterium]
MTPTRRTLYAVAAPLGIGLIKLWWRLCRVVHVDGAQHLDAALAECPSLIPCYWHQHQLFCAKWLLEQRSRGLTVGWLVSPSLDGELGAMLVRRLAGVAIRGSSTHTGARALRDYYQALVKDCVSPIITPDGPRGPRFRCKPGVILLAQMSGRPILPMAYAASSAWLIQWDKFVLPKPLSRLAVAIGAPRRIPRTIDGAELERQQRALEDDLHRLYHVARQALG